MKTLIDIRTAFENEHLLGGGITGESWKPMRSLIVAAMGGELTDEEREYFRRFTKREREPGRRVNKLVIVGGRRIGKSQTTARIAIHQALMCDHSQNLAIGEKGVVLCIAQNMEQAKIVFGYACGIINANPVLRKEVVNITREAIVFKNGIEIQVRPASFRGLRGITCVCAICDETAFWFQEENNSTNPDTEIIAAITPALATTRGMLIIISSPYARRGVVWKFYSKHYGPEGDPLTLVAQGASLDFNSTIDPAEVQEALDEDYGRAQSEWLGQFRTDIESFVSHDAVMACVMPGLLEIPPDRNHIYSCFIDASTGAGGDSFAACIGHMRNEVMVVDAIRNFRPPFSPEAVVSEIAQLCSAYNVLRVFSDSFASGFVSELFNRHCLRHEFCKQNKSQLYVNLLGCINSRAVELLDDKRSIQELINLERRVGFGGRDRVDHPVGCHDDSANVIAGLAGVIREDAGVVELFQRAYSTAEIDAKWNAIERAQREARERANALSAKQKEISE